MKEKVLFVCIHNSARSQMAEAFLKQYAGQRFEVDSAGFEPGVLNPVVVKVMKDVGIDISQNRTTSVFDLLKKGKVYDFVITVCSEAQSDKCPVFPGMHKINWEFDDPSSFEGDEKERICRTKKVRDEIKARIQEWIKN